MEFYSAFVASSRRRRDTTTILFIFCTYGAREIYANYFLPTFCTYGAREIYANYFLPTFCTYGAREIYANYFLPIFAPTGQPQHVYEHCATPEPPQAGDIVSLPHLRSAKRLDIVPTLDSRLQTLDSRLRLTPPASGQALTSHDSLFPFSRLPFAPAIGGTVSRFTTFLPLQS